MQNLLTEVTDQLFNNFQSSACAETGSFFLVICKAGEVLASLLLAERFKQHMLKTDLSLHLVLECPNRITPKEVREAHRGLLNYC